MSTNIDNIKALLTSTVSMPHAAGGRLQRQDSCRSRSRVLRFNAARGRWSVATVSKTMRKLKLKGVSMPHAASGRLQQHEKRVEKYDYVMFQCRTRQVVGCNTQPRMKQTNMLCFNAARGKWSVATGLAEAQDLFSEFQCRTRQVVGCNNSTMSEAP